MKMICVQTYACVSEIQRSILGYLEYALSLVLWVALPVKILAAKLDVPVVVLRTLETW